MAAMKAFDVTEPTMTPDRLETDAGRKAFDVAFDAASTSVQDTINRATHGSTPMKLSGDSKARKATPMCDGVLDYFPLALAAVARVSKVGNDKHNPGQALHWSRDKSTDHADCIVRHLIDRNAMDPDSGELHAAGLAWRALALLQLAEEKRLGIIG